MTEPPSPDPLDVIFQVQVMPSRWGPSPPAAVLARAAVMHTRNGAPREIRWGPMWPASLAALSLTAVDEGSDGPTSWRAVFLDPGDVDGSRAMTMAATLHQLALAEGQPPDFVTYLDRAARALGVGGAVPFAVASPARHGNPAWCRLSATALQPWLDDQLSQFRSTASGREPPPTPYPTLRNALAATRRASPAGEVLARMLAAPPWTYSPGEFTQDMLGTLITAAGQLWHSTRGHDPYGVLSALQRKALDLAAAPYRSRPDRDAGASQELPGQGEDASR
jgi:hypothetical protein